MLCILTIVRLRRGICSAGTIPTPPTLPLITLLLMPPSLTLHMLILSCAGGAERSPEGAEVGGLWVSASVLVLLMLKEGGGWIGRLWVFLWRLLWVLVHHLNAHFANIGVQGRRLGRMPFTAHVVMLLFRLETVGYECKNLLRYHFWLGALDADALSLEAVTIQFNGPVTVLLTLQTDQIPIV